MCAAAGAHCARSPRHDGRSPRHGALVPGAARLHSTAPQPHPTTPVARPNVILHTNHHAPNTSSSAVETKDAAAGDISTSILHLHHLAARSALIEVSSPARSRATRHTPLGRSAIAPLVIAAAAHRSFRDTASLGPPIATPPPSASPHVAPRRLLPPLRLQALQVRRSFALHSSRCTLRPPTTPSRSPLSRSTTSPTESPVATTHALALLVTAALATVRAPLRREGTRRRARRGASNHIRHRQRAAADRLVRRPLPLSTTTTTMAHDDTRRIAKCHLAPDGSIFNI